MEDADEDSDRGLSPTEPCCHSSAFLAIGIFGWFPLCFVYVNPGPADDLYNQFVELVDVLLIFGSERRCVHDYLVVPSDHHATGTGVPNGIDVSLPGLVSAPHGYRRCDVLSSKHPQLLAFDLIK